jgi:hypothetical protein
MILLVLPVIGRMIDRHLGVQNQPASAAYVFAAERSNILAFAFGTLQAGDEKVGILY